MGTTIHRMRQRMTIGAQITALMLALLATAAAQADRLDRVKPEKVGFSSERLENIDAAMQLRVDNGVNSGMVIMVVRHGKVVYEKAFGKADIERNIPMQTDSLFRLYSMTKPITSVALLQLYEAGKFQLSDPLEMYIPEFKDLKVYAGEDANGKPKLEAMKRKPTIHDIFRHTAGFTYGAFSKTGVDLMYQQAGIDYGIVTSLQDLVEKLGKMPLMYQPGTRWVYSFSHDVQAYLVEKLSGQPFDEYVRQHILTPLAMDDTVFGIPDSVVDRYVTNYSPKRDGSGLEAIDVPTDPVPETMSGLRGGYKRFTKIPFGGVSLSSTARDYARFGVMLLNGGELDGVRILGEKTVELMRQNHLPDGINGITFAAPGSTGWGLGVSVLLDPVKDGNLGSAGEFGWSGAATTKAIFDPVEDMVVIIMGQQMSSDSRMMAEAKTLVYQAIIQ